MAADKWRCTLAWGNPYTTPTGPRVLGAVLCDKPYPVPAELLALSKPGEGYCIRWECIEQRPIKRWSQAAKAKVRQANLRRRIEKKFPLFAEVFIAAELASRPQYYEAADAAPAL